MPAHSVRPCGSGGTEVVTRAASPLHPPPVIQHGLGVVDAGAFEEHHQIVIAVGGAEYLVPAVPVHADPSAPGGRRPVHDDGRAARASRVLLPTPKREQRMWGGQRPASLMPEAS